MDNFIDKLAQKFNAQELIKANTQAEAKELERLQLQVAEYERILQEIYRAFRAAWHYGRRKYRQA